MRISTFRLSLVLVAIVAATAPPVASADEGGLIAFESNRDGPLTEIYTMRPDGSAQTRLTHNAVRDISATWSPDGSAIALARGLGNWELFQISADGSSEERLTATPQDEVNPVWAPDGHQIAFERQRRDGTDLVVLDLDTRQERLVAGGSARPSSPTWSPDGSQLAYAVRTGRHADVVITDLDSGQTSPMTDTPVDEAGPVWSPDGDHIAFTRRAGTGAQLVVADAGGGGEQTLVTGARDSFAPVWSPSGASIAFSAPNPADRSVEGQYAISRIDLATGEVRQLTASAPWRDVAPDWGDPPQATLARAAVQALPIPTFCTKTDNNGGHKLYGSQYASDVLCGRGGADRLYGLGNADTLKGGTGDDDLYGNRGSDDLITRGDGGGDLGSGGRGADEAWIDCPGDTVVSAVRRCG